MKTEFSKEWKASKQPRKQRKYLANAPLHLKRKQLSVNLSKDLRAKHGKRNVVLRKGDTVKVMRGKFNKKEGKVTSINIKQLKVFIEGIQTKKMDGSKVDVRLRPSNLQIIALNLEDQKRGLVSKTGKEEIKKSPSEGTKAKEEVKKAEKEEKVKKKAVKKTKEKKE